MMTATPEPRTIPPTTLAVQLVGPSQLCLNAQKPVPTPGPTQLLAQVEAVGLCFSDVKLLKQFSGHVRKGPVVAGLTPTQLEEMPQYVPSDAPAVPGHEVVCRVVAVGSEVKYARVGDRYIVQADYRELKTAGSNGAFGYNFEGGLQGYVLFDERVTGDPSAETGYLIPVPEDRSRSQLALVEPWACVENSYVTPERQGPREGGRMLVAGRLPDDLASALENLPAHPAEVWALGPSGSGAELPWDGMSLLVASSLDDLPETAFDDIVVFGADAAVVQALDGRLANGGILNIVQDGETFGAPVTIDVGRVHYGGTRIVGTPTGDPADGYAMIPATGEAWDGATALVIGAGGPMGQMHVIRLLAQFPNLTVVGTDTDAARLVALSRKVAAVPGAGDRFRGALASELGEATFDVVAIMAPVPALIAEALQRARPEALINVFAGIPAGTSYALDLDAIISLRAFVLGTSGSEPRDMRLVLDKVTSGTLDTNLSVAAVCGMAGALDGLQAVEERTMDGKIVVYPQLTDLPLTPLERLATVCPSAAVRMRHGVWTQEAEDALLEAMG